jgi:hypothetical protein
MQPWRIPVAVTLLAAITLLASSYPALAQSESPPDVSTVSSFWSPAVQRWDSLIVEHAQNRSLDPDLVAAVIWKESLGRAQSRGPVGAVGLMGLMPFDWRPPADELEQPWTNLFWGTRALAQTIRDGDGDLYYSLAAYNGGWGQIHLRVTRRYAADVLTNYARAVAARNELPADGDWVAIFAVEGTPDPHTITVISTKRSPARYTERPWDQTDIPTVPAGMPPHATVIAFETEPGVACRVNMWLVAEGSTVLASPTDQTTPSSRHLAAEPARATP